VADNSCNNAASQGSVSWGNDSQDQRVIEAMDATNIVGSQPWSETTTEGDGDIDVAPVPNTRKEPETPVVKADYDRSNDPTGKKALHKRLNKRSVNFIRKISDTESSTSNDSLETMIASSLKAVSPANLKDLQKIPKLSLLPLAETVDKIPKLALLPVAGSVETIRLPSLLPVAELAEEDSEFPPPAAAASGSQTGEDPSLNRSESISLGLNVHRGGPPVGPSRGGTRGHSSSSRSSTSAAAYSTVAATPRNFLIHVYWSRDDLELGGG
jgi:hypothetical protein